MSFIKPEEGFSSEGNQRLNDVPIHEGEIKVSSNIINYPGIDSCLTVTALTTDKNKPMIGGHFVFVPTDGQIRSERMIEEFRALSTGSVIKSLLVLGDEGWPASKFHPEWSAQSVKGGVAIALGVIFGTENVKYCEVKGDLQVELTPYKEEGLTVRKNGKDITSDLEPAFSDYFTLEDARDYLNFQHH